jgi:hypothetical protein
MYLSEVGPVGQTLVQMHAVLGAQAIFWCAMSLLILFLSMWKLERDSLAGMCEVARRAVPQTGIKIRAGHRVLQNVCCPYLSEAISKTIDLF